MKFDLRKVRLRVLKVTFVFGIAAVLVVIFYPLYVDKLPRVPLWVAMHARQNASRVRVGMTEAEVWSTLGLGDRGFHTHHGEGSGPASDFRENYRLWPGYYLSLHWNFKTSPATVAKFEFKDRP